MGQSTLHWLQETEADWTERLFILMAETSHWRYTSSSSSLIYSPLPSPLRPPAAFTYLAASWLASDEKQFPNPIIIIQQVCHLESTLCPPFCPRTPLSLFSAMWAARLTPQLRGAIIRARRGMEGRKGTRLPWRAAQEKTVTLDWLAEPNLDLTDSGLYCSEAVSFWTREGAMAAIDAVA